MCRGEDAVSRKDWKEFGVVEKKTDIVVEKSVDTLTNILQRVEDLNPQEVLLEMAELTKPECNLADHQVFEMYLIYVFQLKRWNQKTARSGVYPAVISLETKAFNEYFPALRLQEKASIASNILKESIFFELDLTTMITLIQRGVDVEKTSVRYNLGLQVWQGTWLHYLASRPNQRLDREWFTDANTACVCDSEGLQESVLDQVLNSESSLEIKYYNIVLSIAMGCNPLNVDVEYNSLQLLIAAANAVFATEKHAQNLLRTMVPEDLVQLISTYYVNNWTRTVQVIELNVVKMSREC